jgi:hypothetical protein
MINYFLTPTIPEVFRIIATAHSGSLQILSEFSEKSEGRGRISYGFKNSACPLVEEYIFWDVDPENPDDRRNEQYRYWLCSPVVEETVEVNG